MQAEIFEREHPELKPLADANENKELLMWAHNERYIRLKKFGRKFYYTAYDLADAKMWKEKEI